MGQIELSKPQQPGQSSSNGVKPPSEKSFATASSPCRTDCRKYAKKSSGTQSRWVSVAVVGWSAAEFWPPHLLA